MTKMNERIKELAKQADAGFNEGFYQEVVGITMSPQELEKFAELIVKECGQYLMRDEFIGRSDLDWSMVLNEHFGVKRYLF